MQRCCRARARPRLSPVAFLSVPTRKLTSMTLTTMTISLTPPPVRRVSFSPVRCCMYQLTPNRRCEEAANGVVVFLPGMARRRLRDSADPTLRGRHRSSLDRLCMQSDSTSHARVASPRRVLPSRPPQAKRPTDLFKTPLVTFRIPSLGRIRYPDISFSCCCLPYANLCSYLTNLCSSIF